VSRTPVQMPSRAHVFFSGNRANRHQFTYTTTNPEKMPRHNRETSPLNWTRETIRTSSVTRADSAARSLSTGRTSSHRRTASQSEVAPKLGGRAALLLFIAILVAFVVQSSATQMVSDKPTSYYISLMLHTFRINFPITTNLNVSASLLLLGCTNSHQASPSSFLTQKIVTAILLTIAIALPGLLWYIAVSLGPSISDVTAIWNTSALWAYILSVAMLPVDFGTEAPSAWWRRLELRKLVVIAMACAGVAVVVYSGSDASSDKKDTSDEKNKSEVSAPLLGNLLTVLASVLYALVQ
ncbi:11570_t:CDS:2, partial [Acaulospora colombiana]